MKNIKQMIKVTAADSKPIISFNKLQIDSSSIKLGGTKHDEGKPEYDRISFEAIGHFNAVHKFGDEKYEKGNWRKGLHITRLCNAAVRHISAVLSGNFKDGESSLLHSAHAGVCLEMITHFLLHKDKYKEYIDIEEEK